MKKIFLTTVLVFLFATPALADGAPWSGFHDGGGSSPPTGGGSGGGTPPNPTGITRVQQLTANLAYQLHELSEYPAGTKNYNFYASQRLAKQLTAAQAAAAAGSPLPPILQENGNVAPLTIY